MPHVQPALNTERRQLLASGAIKVLAEQGARGLTHRRLDRELGLPEGATSNAFPTRGALFSAALASLADPTLRALDAATEQLPDELDLATAAGVFTETVFAWLEPNERDNLVARFELILESTRQEALRETLAQLRAAFVDVARRLATSAGSPDPARAATLLVSLADGTLIAHLSAQSDPPTREQLANAALAVLGPLAQSR